ncbi:MAG: ribbon-helix-helix domain-containing protein [Methyloceanibacter sp.]|jgi:predicted DNA-binding ribbon-helix-helix protein
MATTLHKRSITIARHRTSISLEDEFWDALCALAARDGRSVADLVGEIDLNRGGGGTEAAARPPSLSAAIRLYVLGRTQADKR